MFEVHEVAHEMVRALKPLVPVVRRQDPDLAKQLRRAAQSVPLNIGEGNRRAGADRLQHFRIAAGSADETRDALRIAESWSYLKASDTRAALELVDRVLAMLWRLINPGD